MSSNLDMIDGIMNRSEKGCPWPIDAPVLWCALKDAAARNTDPSGKDIMKFLRFHIDRGITAHEQLVKTLRAQEH